MVSHPPSRYHADMFDEEPKDFESFWPQFLNNHQNPWVRWAHVAALGCGIGALLAARRGRVARAITFGSAAAALAVASHQVLDGHGPQNFDRPLWAARGFLRLCARTVSGRIQDDLDKLNTPT